MSADKPLPCPFCGGEADLLRTVGGEHYVRCRARCLDFDEGQPCTRILPRKADALRIWNTRAQGTP